MGFMCSLPDWAGPMGIPNAEKGKPDLLKLKERSPEENRKLIRKVNDDSD
jgi:hypothetical protein